jgi:acyl carrier protein
MQDLTMESIDIVMLIVAIEEKFGKKGLPFDTLLMEEGRYVEELKVAQIADFLKTNLPAVAPA